jgi:CO/xanthine dehydrogenase Mo-binding subunit
MAAEGQVEGGIVQGIGYALTESYFWERGSVTNTSFADYKIPTTLDVPPISIAFIESNDPNCPYGAKGVGEPTLIATPPAIANAIFHAIGVRIKELPITPEKILRALKDKS